MATSELRFAVKPSLTPSELDDVGALVREARWNQLAADWRIFLELGRVYAAHTGAAASLPRPRPCPTASRFAWISMVLVTGELSPPRPGDAADAPGDGRTRARGPHPHPRCDARRPCRLSPARIRRLLGLCAAAPPGAATHAGALRRPARTSSYAQSSIRIGRRCAPMTPLPSAPTAAPCLRGLRGRLPAAEFVAERAGRVVGFALGRDGGLAAQIGPLIAEDEAIAAALLARALDGDRRSAVRRPRRQQAGAAQLPRRARLRRRAAVHAHAVWVVDALRRCGAHLRRDRAGIRIG